MRIGIMQPYFWPYMGYFQLMNAVDKFVVYDNIQYTKKGWFNRNRYLCNGTDKYFTVPLEKDSDYLDVKERKVSKNFNKEKIKNQITAAYIKAPYYDEIFSLFCNCIEYNSKNLFEFIYYSLEILKTYLEIETEMIISSSLDIGHEKRGKEKVLAICKKLNGTEYINAIGGRELYRQEDFLKNNIQLSFIQMDKNIVYPQFSTYFVESLSILDVLMFNSKENVKEMLEKYTLCI